MKIPTERAELESAVRKATYEIGRYRKKVEDQARMIEMLKGRVEDAGAGAVQMMQYADCVCIQTAISYGEREEEDGEVVGYRLELPALDLHALLEKYEMRCRMDEIKRTVIIGVMERKENEQT